MRGWRNSKSQSAAIGLALMVATGLGVVATSGAASATGSRAMVRVSAVRGVDSATCGSSESPCATIGQGVLNSAPGGTVKVLPGSYHEQVVVTHPLRLRGYGATIDATGLSSGSGSSLNATAVLVLASASGSTIEGFRVTGAYGEGILVLSASHVRIRHNRVYGNDLGTPETTTYLECQAQGEVPGDCGEGVHLMSASDSTVTHNWITGNSGGVLVTDEFGPAFDNRIVHNLIADNLYDCGVTLPSHNPDALASDGTRQPDLGGVYDNVVRRNRIIGNGTLGEGAGVLFAAALPGAASYDNQVLGNLIRDNNLSGVTIHAHAPNQDVSGNFIAHNTILRNNLGGDPDAGVFDTTGILVFAPDYVSVSVTIRHNHIHGNVNPIWTSPTVTVLP